MVDARFEGEMATKRISVKRYGVRYGRTLKEKIGKIELEKRATNLCPYCHYRKLSRPAAGIWLCGKCGSKFTGGAYIVGKKVKKVEESEEVAAEAKGDAGKAAAEEE